MLTRLKIYLHELASDKKNWLILIPAICHTGIITWILAKGCLYYCLFVKNNFLSLSNETAFFVLLAYAFLELPFTILSVVCVCKNNKNRSLSLILFTIQFSFIYGFFLRYWVSWAFGLSGLMLTVGD
jgi:hypothetical protein